MTGPPENPNDSEDSDGWQRRGSLGQGAGLLFTLHTQLSPLNRLLPFPLPLQVLKKEVQLNTPVSNTVQKIIKKKEILFLFVAPPFYIWSYIDADAKMKTQQLVLSSDLQGQRKLGEDDNQFYRASSVPVARRMQDRWNLLPLGRFRVRKKSNFGKGKEEREE